MDMTFPKGLIKAKLFDDEKSSELLKIISRIESLISDFGFDGLFEELTSENKCNSHHSIGSSNLINIIPSNSKDPMICCNLALAIAKGTRGNAGLGQVLQQVRRHLIYCAGNHSYMSTKNVIIIYDKEDTRAFWENKRDFLSHKNFNDVTFVRLFWDGNRFIEKAIMK
jgi:hypothetical protein